jgi:hypothetical protein
MDSLRLSYGGETYGDGAPMPPVSFHSSAVDGQELSAIMRDYLTLERLRVYRRLLVRRFGLLAVSLGVAGSLRWMPTVATGFSVALCMALPLWTWMTEIRCDRRLMRRLDSLPQRALSVKKS